MDETKYCKTAPTVLGATIATIVILGWPASVRDDVNYTNTHEEVDAYVRSVSRLRKGTTYCSALSKSVVELSEVALRRRLEVSCEVS